MSHDTSKNLPGRQRFGDPVLCPRPYRAGAWLFVAVYAVGVARAAPATRLKISTFDETGQRIACRILVRSEEGACCLPEVATTIQLGRDIWFASPGRADVPIPDTDRVLLRVERGLEYERHKRWIDTSSSDEVEVTLRRWIDMRQRGYRCGENHLHLTTNELAPLCVAEGLDFGTSLTWWRGPDERRPVPAGGGKLRQLSYGGQHLPTSVYDAELEYDWGAAYIQGLPEPLPLRAESGRPNLAYLQHATERGAIVHYQGGWSREVLLDALLGHVHTVNVCNNNFALHRFQPRRRYSNLLHVEGFPAYPNTPLGMMQLNTDTYYRLLNCGLRLAAGAGTATGVKQAPPGYNRAYVRAAGEPSLAEFYGAWKAGRNFVTNGPVLLLNTASGQQPGDTIELGDASSLRLNVEAISDCPLTRVEVVVNGQVAVSIPVTDLRHVVGSCELRVEDSAWVAARCTANDQLLSDRELEAYRDHQHPDQPRVAPSRLRFAHTSPIYVRVGGRPVAVESSLREALQMLAALGRFAGREADPRYLPDFMAAIARARAVLTERLRAVAPP